MRSDCTYIVAHLAPLGPTGTKNGTLQTFFLFLHLFFTAMQTRYAVGTQEWNPWPLVIRKLHLHLSQPPQEPQRISISISISISITITSIRVSESVVLAVLTAIQIKNKNKNALFSNAHAVTFSRIRIHSDFALIANLR